MKGAWYLSMRGLSSLVLLALLLLSFVVIPTARAGTGFDGNVGDHNRVGIGSVTFATVTVGGTCNAGPQSATGITFAHTVRPGANRFLEVAIFSIGGGPSEITNPITYAGAAMDNQIGQSLPGVSTGSINVWDLSNPATGTNNVVVTGMDSTEAIMVVAIDFVNVAVFSRQQAAVATASTSVTDIIQQGAPPSSEWDFIVSYAALGTTASSSPPAPDAPQITQGFRSNGITGGGCRHLAVSTRQAAGDTTNIGWSSSTSGDYAVIERVLHPTVPIPGAGDAEGEPTGGGTSLGGGFPIDNLERVCAEQAALDWLSATAVSGSRNVTIQDNRPEAALVLVYIIGWGDNTGSSGTKAPFYHTYAKQGVYTITVRIANRDGSINIYNSRVDVRGNNCSLQMFVENVFPLMLMAAGLALLAAIIVTYRYKYQFTAGRRELRNILLAVFIILMGVLIAIALYAQGAGVPI